MRSFGMTINIGHYESVRLEASVETDVKPGETTDAALKRAYDTVALQVQDAVEEMTNKKLVDKDAKD
jgi:hypothetical protein